MTTRPHLAFNQHIDIANNLAQSHSLIDQRDAVLISLLFETPLNRTQLCKVLVSDFDPIAKTVRGHVVRPKVIQFIANWLEHSGVSEGFFLRHISAGNVLTSSPISSQNIHYALKKCGLLQFVQETAAYLDNPNFELVEISKFGNFMEVGYTPNNLRYIREQLGLSQKQLAEKLNYSWRTVQNWEIDSPGGRNMSHANWLELVSFAIKVLKSKNK